VLVSSKSHSPKVATGTKAATLINKYARMMVKYNQTHLPSDAHKATIFFNKNKIGEIPTENINYIPILVQSLQDNPSVLKSITNNEKLLDDLTDIIIKQKDDSVAKKLYFLYQLFEKDRIVEAIEYFRDNELWDVDSKILDIFYENPTVSSVIKKLEASPVVTSPVAPAAFASAVPKLATYSGQQVKRVRRAASASAGPPKPTPKAGKASKAAAASADADLFLGNIFKKAQKQDTRDKILEKYYRLIRERKMKEANAYAKKHSIAKIPSALAKFDSSAVLVNDVGDHVSVTPPADSSIVLSPEVLKKLPYSFGEAAAMAAASGTPKDKEKGKGSVAGTDLASVLQLHEQIVNSSTSPTFKPDDPKNGAPKNGAPKNGAWMG
jgi:hypothetical protein